MILWTHNPLKNKPLRSVLVGSLVVLAIFCFGSMGFLYGLLAALLLFLNASEGLWPSRVALAEEGVRIHNGLRQIRRPWARFTGFRVTPKGILLQGQGPTPWLARRRDLWLPPAQDLAPVRARLQKSLRELP